MPKTKQDILDEIQLTASTRKATISFLKECILILGEYDEWYIRRQITKLKKNIAVYVLRKKQSYDELLNYNTKKSARELTKNFYKSELKQLRKQLRGLKYLIK